MDAHFLVDVDRSVDCGTYRARDQGFHRPSATVGEIGRSLERSEFQLQISRVSVRARGCFNRVLRCSYFRELANRAAVSRDSDADRLFANLRRRALFIGRGLCRRSRNVMRDSCCALFPENRKSAIGNRKLERRG